MNERKRVLVLTELPSDLERQLAAGCDVLLRPEGVGSEEELAALLPGADRLAVVASCAAGLDHLDLLALRRKGVIVSHAPDLLTEAAADLAWGLLLAVVRRVMPADRYVREGRFRGWRSDRFLGRSLAGLTLGVLGAGRTGKAMLRRAAAFGMRGVYFQRSPLGAAEEEDLGATRVAFDELLAQADVVSLHLPLLPETRHLIGRRALERMRRGSYLVNVARGPLIDERALVAALQAGHLAGAGLDVFEREPAVEAGLLELPNVMLTPHIGSATVEASTAMARACVEDLWTVLVEGGRPARAV